MNKKRLLGLITVVIFAFTLIFLLVGCVDDAPKAVTKNIATTDDFLSMANYTGDQYAGSEFVLTADLDFTDVDFTPIGTLDAPFTGLFDGGNHKITGIQLIDDAVLPEFVGLFGAVKNAAIKNVTTDILISQKLTLSGNYLGGIAGAGWGDVEINNVSATLNLSNKFETAESIDPNSDATIISTNTVEYAGGIIGYANGNYHISNASSMVRMNETAIELDGSAADLLRKGAFLGGIAGYAKGAGSIVQCTAQLDAFDATAVSIYAGGAVGYLEGGTLDDVAVTMLDNEAQLRTQNLSAKAYLGGIAGYAFNAIVKNSSFAAQDASKFVASTEFIGSKDSFVFGGAVGYFEASSLVDCNIVFQAQVKGGTAFGGVVGTVKGSKIADVQRTAEISNVVVSGEGFGYNPSEFAPYLGTKMFISAIAGNMRGKVVVKKCNVDIKAYNAYGKVFSEQDVDDDGAVVGEIRVPQYNFTDANKNIVNLDKLVKA